MSIIENELKQLIIDSLALENLSIADIDSNTALFEGGLGLDSIDALELGVAVRKKYQLKISSEQEDVSKIFTSVSSLAAYLKSVLPASASAHSVCN